jgi:hypothetical protein
MLKEKQKRAVLKLANEINLSADNNNNVVDINKNIIFIRDNNSDTTTKKNIKDKEKRKRDPKALHATNSENEYIEEYTDADINTDVPTKISKEKKLDQLKLVPESDTRDNTKINQSSSTTSDLGAFESETTTTSDSTTSSDTNN